MARNNAAYGRISPSGATPVLGGGGRERGAPVVIDDLLSPLANKRALTLANFYMNRDMFLSTPF